MPSWSEHSHPDWVESSFDRDMRESERWQRLEDEEERERELLDRLRERGSSLSGRAEQATGLVAGFESHSARPESDERKEAA